MEKEEIDSIIEKVFPEAIVRHSYSANKMSNWLIQFDFSNALCVTSMDIPELERITLELQKAKFSVTLKPYISELSIYNGIPCDPDFVEQLFVNALKMSEE